MKIYIIYEGKDISGDVIFNLESQCKFRADIPNSWLDKTCDKLLSLFVQQYISIHPEEQLNISNFQLKCGGILLSSTDSIGKFIHEYNNVYVLHKKIEVTESDCKDKQICTNYGCGKHFKDAENSDTACHYHLEGPVFHDLEKYWKCCSSKKAYSWESFQSIPACKIGRHSTKNKPFQFPLEVINNEPLTESQKQTLSAKSGMKIEKRTTGPREFEGGQNRTQEVVNGQAKCSNFGCSKVFNVNENSDTACHFHIQGPVFWDTYKYWKCCPHKKCSEFEDFIKVPGCQVGPHKL